MKSGIRSLILIVTVALLAGCNFFPGGSSDNKKTISTNVTVSSELEKASSNEESVFSKDSNAAAIGRFIEENSAGASEAEADEMMMWLILFQKGMKQDLENKMYKVNDITLEPEPDVEFFEGINTVVNERLEVEKISEVSDSRVRSELENMVAGYLTAMREGPRMDGDGSVVEGRKIIFQPDWQRMSELGTNCSSSFSEMLRLSDKYYCKYYRNPEKNYLDMGKDIVYLESLLEGIEKSFLSTQLNELYQIYIGDFLSDYDGEGDEASILNEILPLIIEKYPDARFSGLISELTDEKSEWIEFSRKRNEFCFFGYNSDYFIQQEHMLIDGHEIEFSVVRMPRNREIEEKIANQIKEQLQLLFDEAEFDELEDWMYPDAHIRSGNDATVSIGFYMYYFDSKGIEHNMVKNRVFDLETGDVVIFEDIFAKSFGEVKDGVPTLHNAKFDTYPSISLITPYKIVLDNESAIDYSDPKRLDSTVVLQLYEIMEYVPMDIYFKN